jgi:hypothetical protein
MTALQLVSTEGRWWSDWEDVAKDGLNAAIERDDELERVKECRFVVAATEPCIDRDVRTENLLPILRGPLCPCST